MLSRGMRDKPIEISQGSLGSISVALPSPFTKMGGGGPDGKATLRVRLSIDHCQSYFINVNATSKLVTKLQVIRDWLIQRSNRISKLSGLRNFDETFHSYSFLRLQNCNPMENVCANFINLIRLHYQLLSPQRPRSRSSRAQRLI